VERFYSKEYYTFAGSVLISMNPCLNVARNQFLDMECMSTMSKYKLNLEKMGTGVDEEILLPHVYSIGLRSLKNLRSVRSNQVIIVSGNIFTLLSASMIKLLDLTLLYRIIYTTELTLHSMNLCRRFWSRQNNEHATVNTLLYRNSLK